MVLNKDIVLLKLFNIALKEKNKQKQEDIFISFCYLLNYISWELIYTDVKIWLDIEIRNEYFQDFGDISTPEAFIASLRKYY